MTRSLLSMVVCALIAASSALADDLVPAPPSSAPPSEQSPAQSPPLQGPSPQAMAEARAACATDIQNLCPSVQPGGGRILACLKLHKEQVSPGCKQAVLKATQRAS
jgi:hypothetical protein